MGNMSLLSVRRMTGGEEIFSCRLFDIRDGGTVCVWGGGGEDLFDAGMFGTGYLYFGYRTVGLSSSDKGKPAIITMPVSNKEIVCTIYRNLGVSRRICDILDIANGKQSRKAEEPFFDTKVVP